MTMDSKAILDDVVASERAKWQPTPGPWHVTGETHVNCAEGFLVASTGYSDDETDQANARLIAAAPDMLAVCKALLDIIYNSQGVAGWHMNGDVATWDEFEDVGALEAAIAAAEGGAK
jgi:hypothetical protein